MRDRIATRISRRTTLPGNHLLPTGLTTSARSVITAGAQYNHNAHTTVTTNSGSGLWI